MEQFVLVPASIYNNKYLNTKTVMTQDLPTYQVGQNLTYQTHSPKKGINKKLFAKADSLVGQSLSCPRIKLSNSQTSLLDGVKTGFLLSDFAQ